jgi:hypothetical protein
MSHAHSFLLYLIALNIGWGYEVWTWSL